MFIEILTALKMVAHQPGKDVSLIHHSHRASQYIRNRHGERLAEAAIEPSVGSREDSYNDALAETINSLYEAELVHCRGAWKTRESVELAALEWVVRFNHHRLIYPANRTARQLYGMGHSESRERQGS